MRAVSSAMLIGLRRQSEGDTLSDTYCIARGLLDLQSLCAGAARWIPQKPSTRDTDHRQSHAQ
jgi:hypothetical protein